jgi:hypothetical protein
MSIDVPKKQFPPEDIASVAMTWDVGYVNKYLAAGWIITAMVKRQTGPESFSLDYHLGWPRQSGEPKEPDLSNDYSVSSSSKFADFADDADLRF